MPNHNYSSGRSLVLFPDQVGANLSRSSTRGKASTATSSKSSSSRDRPSREEHASASVTGSEQNAGLDPTARSMVHQMLSKASAAHVDALLRILKSSGGADIIIRDCCSVLGNNPHSPQRTPALPSDPRPESFTITSTRTQKCSPPTTTSSGSDAPPSYSSTQVLDGDLQVSDLWCRLPLRETDVLDGKLVDRPVGTEGPRDAVSQSKSLQKLKTQCAGLRKDGQRCLRERKALPRSPFLPDDQETPYFCYDHSQDIHPPNGYPSLSGGDWVRFADLIIDHPDARVKRLPNEIKMFLQQRMQMGPSDPDQEGNIYCYQLLKPDDDDYVHFKVGRSNDFVRRLGEWRAKCGASIMLRGWFPGPPEGASLSEVATRKRRASAGLEPMIKNCQWLEGFIHLNLAGVAENIEREPCQCNTRHREIFTFKSKDIRQEDPWDYIIKPIIERWLKFVEVHSP